MDGAEQFEPRLESGRPAVKHVFEVHTAAADGDRFAIPCSSVEELGSLLRRIFKLAERPGVADPPIEVWRFDRTPPRAMSEAEMEEIGLPLGKLRAA